MTEFTRIMRLKNEQIERRTLRIYAFTHLRSNLNSSERGKKSLKNLINE